MSTLIEKLHEVGARVWLRLVQALNWILISLLGSAYVIHTTYPHLISDLLSKLPPVLGIPAIIMVGGLIHYALRRAKKEL